ncbi:MAG: motility associated factor glycosyltransferase family protein, partial [Nitrospinota bacterium]
MTEELFEKNLRLLKLVSPELSRRVIWAKGREEIEGFTARSGAPSLRVCSPDGGSILLHSSYDPEEEARRAAEASGLDEPHRNIFFLGFGLGYLALEVLRRKGHEKRFFFIIEKDLSIFREAMERVDLSELLSDVRVYLLVDLPEEELARRLRFLTEQTLYHGVEFLELPGAMALHGDYYRGARSLVAEMVGVNSMYWSTTFLRGSQSVRNICRNLFCILQSPGVRPLKGAFEGRPALIVSAGPSLDGAIEGVRAAKGKALIIAIGQVLGKLFRAGIEPDLVSTLDYSDLNLKLFF